MKNLAYLPYLCNLNPFFHFLSSVVTKTLELSVYNFFLNMSMSLHSGNLPDSPEITTSKFEAIVVVENCYSKLQIDVFKSTLSVLAQRVCYMSVCLKNFETKQLFKVLNKQRIKDRIHRFEYVLGKLIRNYIQRHMLIFLIWGFWN